MLLTNWLILFEFDIKGPLANISSPFFFLYRSTIKIKGSLLKKQANELCDKYGILQTWSIVSVSIVNQQERPPREYCYHLSVSWKLMLIEINLSQIRTSDRKREKLCAVLSRDIRSVRSTAIVKKFHLDFLWFLILHHSHSLKMCVFLSVCLSVWPSPTVQPKLIDRFRSYSISRVHLQIFPALFIFYFLFFFCFRSILKIKGSSHKKKISIFSKFCGL